VKHIAATVLLIKYEQSAGNIQRIHQTTIFKACIQHCIDPILHRKAECRIKFIIFAAAATTAATAATTTAAASAAAITSTRRVVAEKGWDDGVEERVVVLPKIFQYDAHVCRSDGHDE